MTLGTLPPLDTVRWLPKRKAALVRALQAGLLTIDEACARYSLSIDELAAWQRELARDGQGGLRVSRIQARRNVRPERGHIGPASAHPFAPCSRVRRWSLLFSITCADSARLRRMATIRECNQGWLVGRVNASAPRRPSRTRSQASPLRGTGVAIPAVLPSQNLSWRVLRSVVAECRISRSSPAVMRDAVVL